MIIRLEMLEKVKDLTLSLVINSKSTCSNNTDNTATSIILKLFYEVCLITYKTGRLETSIYL